MYSIEYENKDLVKRFFKDNSFYHKILDLYCHLDEDEYNLVLSFAKEHDMKLEKKFDNDISIDTETMRIHFERLLAN